MYQLFSSHSPALPDKWHRRDALPSILIISHSLVQARLGFNILHRFGFNVFHAECVTIFTFKVQVAFEEEFHLFGRQVNVDDSLEYLPDKKNKTAKT